MLYHIYYIHTGECPSYLCKTIINTKAFNPSNQIFLITDQPLPSKIKKICTKIDITTLPQERIQSFRAAYQHHSTNPYEYERFCFERWLHLEEAIKINQSNYSIYMDSDAYLFSEAKDLVNQYLGENKKYAYFKIGAPHFTIIKDQPTELSHIITNLFESQFYNDCKSAFDKNKQQCLCDMSVLNHLANSYASIHADHASHKNPCIELNMAIKEQYVTWNKKKGIKRIYWKLNQNKLIPYLKVQETDQYVRADVLHYKGSAKRYMRYFNTITPIQWLLPLKVRIYNTLKPLKHSL
jgi:hypothetical protein